MRYVVLILALLGVAAEGWLGNKWRSDAAQERPKMEEMAKTMETVKKAGGNTAEFDEAYAKFNTASNAAWVLLGGAVLGLIGGVLVLMQKGILAAIVMLAGAIAPAALAPPALLFTSILILAGVLAFFVRPKPAK